MKDFQLMMLMPDGSWEPLTADLIPASSHAGCFPVEHRSQAKRAYNRAYMRKWRKTHPMTAEQRRKDNCRSYAGQYLKRGLLRREPCFICDDAAAQMHHPDYGEPLNVVWFCRKHHLYLHKEGLA